MKGEEEEEELFGWLWIEDGVNLDGVVKQM